ncbi:MAG: trypsin-like serine protease, partial [Bdellovibrio sp.]
MTVETPEAQAIIRGQKVSQMEALYTDVLRVKSLLEKKEIKTGLSTQAELQYFQCTGSALNSRIVITAAHCVVQTALEMTVEVSAGPQGPAHTSKVIRSVMFPLYNPQASVSLQDLAILFLEKPLPEYVSTFPIPSEDLLEKVTSILAAGYGKTDETSGQSADGLYRKDLPVRNYQSKQMFFIAQQTEGGTCNGDSGGPALIDIQGKRFIVGVLSSSLFPTGSVLQCQNEALYVNLPFFARWIRTQSEAFLKGE